MRYAWGPFPAGLEATSEPNRCARGGRLGPRVDRRVRVIREVPRRGPRSSGLPLREQPEQVGALPGFEEFLGAGPELVVGQEALCAEGGPGRLTMLACVV